VNGYAWRILIPVTSPIHGSKLINNLLEFLGMAINIWLECLETEPGEHPCILALGDSTSAIGWINSTSTLNPTWMAHAAHLVVARKIASIVMEAGCCLATQHIRGELNQVADLLSFAGDITRAGGKKHPLAFDDPPNDILTQRFHAHYASQIPETFGIFQLPNEILSWVTHVLQIAELSLTGNKKGHTRIATASGAAGEDSAERRETTLTPSSLLYLQESEMFAPSPLYSATAQLNGASTGSLRESVSSTWRQALCGRPQATWLRRFGTISNRVPFTSRGQQTCEIKSTNSVAPTKTLTPHPRNKKRSPPSCCDKCSS